MKAKLINCDTYDGLEREINYFIEDKNVKTITACESRISVTAIILYEEEEEYE